MVEAPGKSPRREQSPARVLEPAVPFKVDSWGTSTISPPRRSSTHLRDDASYPFMNCFRRFGTRFRHWTHHHHQVIFWNFFGNNFSSPVKLPSGGASRVRCFRGAGTRDARFETSAYTEGVSLFQPSPRLRNTKREGAGVRRWWHCFRRRKNGQKIQGAERRGWNGVMYAARNRGRARHRRPSYRNLAFRPEREVEMRYIRAAFLFMGDCFFRTQKDALLGFFCQNKRNVYLFCKFSLEPALIGCLQLTR